MFQDIEGKLVREERGPQSGDMAVVMKYGRVLADENGQTPGMDLLTDPGLSPQYLLTLKRPDGSETAFFYISHRVLEEKGILSEDVLVTRAADPASEAAAAQVAEDLGVVGDHAGELSFAFRPAMGLFRNVGSDEAFAGATAMHLAKWYDENHFCGYCGGLMEAADDERALTCPDCGRRIYPAIAPVVIVGVTRGDELLLTRYASRDGYRRHALIAGFAEVGETLEQTVAREVYEEAGLRVHGLRYFASQPWAFSQSLLAGFFCEVDEGCEITLNTDGKEELSEAVWVRREDIEPEDNYFSLTWTMIRSFKAGLV